MQLSDVVALAFISCIVIYMWLKLRDEFHNIILHTYSGFDIQSYKSNQEKLKELEEDDERTEGGQRDETIYKAPNPMPDIATMSFTIALRVFVFGVIVYIAVMIMTRCMRFLQDSRNEEEFNENINEESKNATLPLSKFALNVGFLLLLGCVSIVTTVIYSRLCITEDDALRPAVMHTHVDALLYILLIVYLCFLYVFRSME